MGIQQVSMVNAVATYAQRIARNRSGVLRTGQVVSAVTLSPGAGMATVTVGGDTVQAAFGIGRPPVKDDVVALLNDRDAWFILGVMADKPASYPFAMSCGSAPLPISGLISATVAVAYPVGRFTVAPVVTNSLYTGSGSAQTAYTVRAMTNSKNGITFGLVTQATATVDYAIYWTAIQFTATGSVDPAPLARDPGRTLDLAADESDLVQFTVICPTEGCINETEPIDLIAPADADLVVCGPCRAHLTPEGVRSWP